ncbi:DMT family transporter [Paracoccus bogoriensis]|uniref:DMT family transporter n=1 Tax=Paracoccus bogoriensis TaxID=242065 RepID=UPI001C675CED|nr:DMT family transporter [Paracoccus bogoriensis]MBW7057371.1 DMT family transporter [Paracoccus bogoriensis]
MTDWIAQITGTPEGARIASVLALSAAFLHALFGALQKGRHDPWVSRAAIDICYGLMALPLALFVVPWPEPALWPVLAGAMVIHIAYKLAQAMTYQRGAYTVVYPVVRGSAPLFAVLAAMAIFDERFNALQWAGLILLVGGIFGLAGHNLRKLTLGRDTLLPALAWAMVTGGMVALYTTYDAWGIRLAQNPFTFLAWFFLLDSLFMPLFTLRRLRALPRSEIAPLAARGGFGALVAFASFGSIMLATRIDDVGRAAVLRETSTVFAALVGWAVLGEKVGAQRTALMALIALGALVVEFGAR